MLDIGVSPTPVMTRWSLRRMAAVALTALIAATAAAVAPGSESRSFAASGPPSSDGGAGTQAWFTYNEVFPTLFACQNTGSGGVSLGRWDDYYCEYDVFARVYILWVEVVDTKVLRLYWNPQRSDNLTTDNVFGGEGYMFVGTLGLVAMSQEPGSVPLRLFWNPSRSDNLTTNASSGGEGYSLVGIVGYVYPSQRTGTCPLRLFWNPDRSDNLTTNASSGGEGYSLVGIVGYVWC